MAEIEINVVCVPEGPSDLSPLSAAERERHAGMEPAAAKAFACGRSLLRQMLGAALGLAPQDVELMQSGAGRVVLTSVNEGGPFFSVSHTQLDGQAFVAVAVSASVPVGLDIEAPDRLLDWRRMAARRYHDAERQLLFGQAETDARIAFFEIWTRKEALVKLRDGKLLPTLAAPMPDTVFAVTRSLAPLPLIGSVVADEAAARTIAWHLPGDRA